MIVNPTIEQSRVTITWYGVKAPYFISDLHGWEENPQPLRKTGDKTWEISFELPLDAYLEYAFLATENNARVPDPLNTKRISNGVGSYNHFFYMPGSGPSPLRNLPSAGLSGRISRHIVPARFSTASKERRVYLYHPPTDQPVPLLVVYDGMDAQNSDYYHRVKLASIVDNLIAAQRIRPLAVAFLQNGGPARGVEYGCAEPTLGFLVGQVLPLVSQELNLLPYTEHPGIHGILGDSMGGLMAVYTSLRLPHIFGKALSQAGAFHLWGYESIVVQMVRYFPKPDVKFWLNCGVMDFLIGANRQMAALLEEKGYDFTYNENSGAHNYTTFGNTCAQGLEALFGNSISS
jgi:enterochelin esterase family protein